MMQGPKNQLRSDGLLRSRGHWITRAQRLLDSAIIGGSLWIANLFFHQVWSRELAWAGVLAVVWFQLAAPVSGLYRSWRNNRLGEELTAVAGTWIAVVPALLFAAFATKTTDSFSRLLVGTWLISAPLGVMLARAQVRSLLRHFRRTGRNERRVAIAGATESGAKLARTIAGMKDRGNRVIGIYDDRSPDRLAKQILGRRGLGGNLSDLVEQTKAGTVDTVYIALPLRAERRIQDLISKLADTTATVFVVTDLFMFDLMNARWGSVGEMPVVSVFDTPFHGLGGWVKRLEDILLSSIILCLIALPMLFIAIAVKLTSRGPVFFMQRRYGLNGKSIKVLKFRSMTSMDDGAKVVQATKNDVRITKLGGFLRRSSLDELPQFWNVLMGDMSVVGPRPHAVAHNELYRGKIRGYMLRHKVKPGITGWAQVNGWRGETEAVGKMEGRIEHDLYYIDNWSLFWDLKIVFLTVFGRKVRSNAH
jgi:putative colanic acid biosynthesis UDP-glucose lipid carrier transferase